jgi:hypothetical protein
MNVSVPCFCRHGFSRIPVLTIRSMRRDWIPAFAGMTS